MPLKHLLKRTVKLTYSHSSGFVISVTYMQHCRLVLGPPNLGLSRQFTHFAQSSSIKQPLQCPQRRARTPPGAYSLRTFLFRNLRPFPLPLLLLRWMCSWETTHWALPWSVMSSSSSATSASERKRGWVKRAATYIFKHHVRACDVRQHFWMPELNYSDCRRHDRSNCSDWRCFYSHYWSFVQQACLVSQVTAGCLKCRKSKSHSRRK